MGNYYWVIRSEFSSCYVQRVVLWWNGHGLDKYIGPRAAAYKFNTKASALAVLRALRACWLSEFGESYGGAVVRVRKK